MSNFIKDKIEDTQKAFQENIRKKAIVAAKARLVEKGVDYNELSDEEFEIIVEDEERKIKDGYKSNGLVGAGALIAGLFGLNLLG